MISTFGCNNGLILAGARAYYAMARDGLFFRAAGQLNARRCRRGDWCCRASGRRSSSCRAPTIRRRAPYGNLYSNLLDYVISAALIFYILTIAGIFRLRRTRPDVERPYRAFGYPVVPALYIAGAATILLVLFVYRPATTWPGLVIVLLGVPVYFAWRPRWHDRRVCVIGRRRFTSELVRCTALSSPRGLRDDRGGRLRRRSRDPAPHLVGIRAALSAPPADAAKIVDDDEVIFDAAVRVRG